MKQVAHRIDEDHLRHAPAQGFGEFFRYQAQVKPLLVWMAFDSPEPFSKYFSVTMLATGTDLCAAPHRVPRRVCPFDSRRFGHVPPPFFQFLREDTMGNPFRSAVLR